MSRLNLVFNYRQPATTTYIGRSVELLWVLIADL